MDFIVTFLGNAVGFLWGTPLIVLVLGSGALFTIGTGFFQFRHFKYLMGKTFGSLFKKEEREVGSGHVSAFQAISTAIGREYRRCGYGYRSRWARGSVLAMGGSAFGHGIKVC